jgi:hypothetical protein
MKESDDPIPESDEEDVSIPESDEKFDDWLDNFVDYAKKNLDRLQITAAEIARIEAARDKWKTDYDAHLEAAANARKAELELAKVTHRGKIDPRERRDGGTLPLIIGVDTNEPLQKLMDRNTEADLQEILR